MHANHNDLYNANFNTKCNTTLRKSDHKIRRVKFIFRINAHIISYIQCMIQCCYNIHLPNHYFMIFYNYSYKFSGLSLWYLQQIYWFMSPWWKQKLVFLCRYNRFHIVAVFTLCQIIHWVLKCIPFWIQKSRYFEYNKGGEYKNLRQERLHAADELYDISHLFLWHS